MKKFRIGRSTDCDIVISDPSVSRKHAEVTIDNNDITVKDLNSSNGTFVNGYKIKAPYSLKEYDILKVGNVLVHWKNHVGMNTPAVTSSVASENVDTYSGEVATIPSVGDWLVYYLLLMIPLINIIILFVWANDGDNQVRRNWSIANLIWGAIITLITIVIYSVLI